MKLLVPDMLRENAEVIMPLRLCQSLLKFVSRGMAYPPMPIQDESVNSIGLYQLLPVYTSHVAFKIEAVYRATEFLRYRLSTID